MRTFHPFCRVRVCAALLINTWYANDHAILDIPIDYDRYIPVALVLKFWYQNFCCSSGMLYQSIDVLTLLQSLLPPGLKTMSASFELSACQSASLTALFTPLPIHLRQFNIIYIMYGIWGHCLFKSDKRFWPGKRCENIFFLLKEGLWKLILVALVKAMNEVMSLTDVLETCGRYLVDCWPLTFGRLEVMPRLLGQVFMPSNCSKEVLIAILIW